MDWLATHWYEVLLAAAAVIVAGGVIYQKAIMPAFRFFVLLGRAARVIVETNQFILGTRDTPPLHDRILKIESTLNDNQLALVSIQGNLSKLRASVEAHHNAAH